MQFRHAAAAVLECAVLLGVLDIAGLHGFDELAVIGYGVFYLIPAVALFTLSVVNMRRDRGYLYGFSVVGVVTSVGSVCIAFGQFLFAF